MVIPVVLALLGGFAATLVVKRPGIFLPLAIGSVIGFLSQVGLLMVIFCVLAGMAGAFVAASLRRR